MKSAHASCKLTLLALALGVSHVAWAQDSGWLIGASLGPTQTRIDDDRIGRDLLGQGLVVNAISDSDRDNGYKIFGGYQMNKNFSIEGGYFDLGKFGFTATTLPPGTLDGRIKLRGLNLDLVGTLPLSQRWSVLGRIGANYAEAQDNFTGTGAVTVLNPSPSKRDTNLKVGLGVQYALTDSLLVRSEIERYRIDDAVGNKGDVDHLTIGLVYRFGMNPPPPVVRMAAPEPMPVAVMPAPIVVAVAPPPPLPPAPVRIRPVVPVKVSFSAESLFGFDQSAVSPTGKQHLDNFATDLRNVDFEVITVTGHTDRIGAHKYNVALSERRATAVKTYLTESAGLPEAKIVAKGVNGSEPVTKPGECVGSKGSKTLIACLQPDRRVDIEVSGTR